jgi:predicted HicB family RNase H-like nuclease
MLKVDEACTQLATRIPKELHRRLKLHSVTADVTVMEFVIQAIEEALGRKAKKRKA